MIDQYLKISNNLKPIAIKPNNFNKNAITPYGLTIEDFRKPLEDCIHWLTMTNDNYFNFGFDSLEMTIKADSFSSLIGEHIIKGISKYNSILSKNNNNSGCPDLLLKDVYKNNSILSSDHGIEVKTTSQDYVWTWGKAPKPIWLLALKIDCNKSTNELPKPFRFEGVFLAPLEVDDWNIHPKKNRGTDSSATNAKGKRKLMENWIYQDKNF